jgi:hypothetical protein
VFIKSSNQRKRNNKYLLLERRGHDMKPDPVLVLSISSGLFIVTFVLLLRWTSRFTYKRFLKYYIVRFRQMREEDKIAAAMAIGFSVVYGIMLVIYTQ